jgi:hypothetical protein
MSLSEDYAGDRAASEEPIDPPPPWPYCKCGCAQLARPKGLYASAACRTRFFDSMHPRLDLSGLDDATRLRAERLVGEAVRAAKEGCERATVDARFPVRHERDTRAGGRVRLDAETWEILDELCAPDPDPLVMQPYKPLSRSALVRGLIWAASREKRDRQARRSA